MTPYVIDKQKQLTIYLLFILGIIVSFGIGFVFGYQIGNLESAIQPSAVIEQPAVEDAAAEEDGKSADEKPEEADKTSSVGQKKTDKLAASKPEKKQAQKAPVKQAPEKQLVQKISEKKVAAVKKPPVVKQQKKPEVAKPSVTTVQTQQKTTNQTSSSSQQTQSDVADKNQAAKQLATENTNLSESADSSKTADKKRYYSVQAGLFASRDNAVKFLDELMSNGFDAYIQDFVSSSGEVKYNVRFGRTESREATRQRLSEFRQAFSTPAYVVIGN